MIEKTDNRFQGEPWKFGDFLDLMAFESSPRIFGVQLIVQDGQGRIWRRSDTEGLDRHELYISPQELYLSNGRLTAPYNAVGGALDGFWEDPLAGILREAREEIGPEFSGTGEFELRRNLPLIGAYQEKNSASDTIKGFIIGVSLVLYTTDQQETRALSLIGEYVRREVILQDIAKSPYYYRPTYSLAIRLLPFMDDLPRFNALVLQHNLEIVRFAEQRAKVDNVSVQFGVFNVYRGL